MHNQGDVLRHSAYSRVLHWAAALCFILGLLSGLGLLYPQVFGWLQLTFGGNRWALLLHPWFGLGFVFFFTLQFINWLSRMRWTPVDRDYLRHLAAQVFRRDRPAPAATGFFNGGQKLYFWTLAASAAVFLSTGMVYWFKQDFPRNVYLELRFVHRACGLLMGAALLVHLYQATIGEPGVLRSMFAGKVTKEWARTRRPRWDHGPTE